MSQKTNQSFENLERIFDDPASVLNAFPFQLWFVGMVIELGHCRPDPKTNISKTVALVAVSHLD